MRFLLTNAINWKMETVSVVGLTFRTARKKGVVGVPPAEKRLALKAGVASG